eukprot:2679861-Rhodomonas_salina.1
MAAIMLTREGVWPAFSTALQRAAQRRVDEAGGSARSNLKPHTLRMLCTRPEARFPLISRQLPRHVTSPRTAKSNAKPLLLQYSVYGSVVALPLISPCA